MPWRTVCWEGELSEPILRHIVSMTKPLVKFERLKTHLAFAPIGFNHFVAAMPVAEGEALLGNLLGKEFRLAPDLTCTGFRRRCYSENTTNRAALGILSVAPTRRRLFCAWMVTGMGHHVLAWLGDGNALTPCGKFPVSPFTGAAHLPITTPTTHWGWPPMGNPSRS